LFNTTIFRAPFCAIELVSDQLLNSILSRQTRSSSLIGTVLVFRSCSGVPVVACLKAPDRLQAREKLGF